jgi:hypothetical protein
MVARAVVQERMRRLSRQHAGRSTGRFLQAADVAVAAQISVGTGL